MKRFRSTTAVLAALSGTAHADAHGSIFCTVTCEQSGFNASDVVGMRVYRCEVELWTGVMVQDGAEQEWDGIGEVNDIIVCKDGEIRVVILGIGGFICIGERDFRVGIDAIKVMQEDNGAGDRFLGVTTPKEML